MSYSKTKKIALTQKKLDLLLGSIELNYSDCKDESPIKSLWDKLIIADEEAMDIITLDSEEVLALAKLKREPTLRWLSNIEKEVIDEITINYFDAIRLGDPAATKHLSCEELIYAQMVGVYVDESQPDHKKQLSSFWDQVRQASGCC